MVFESLVVDLMNKYLGAYIENLDASQLKLGIWGGDAVLENLHVKGDALKDLDLPVTVASGFIGKLTLKIPWKNLYKDAVEATLESLYILAVPNTSVKYDEKKEAEKAEKEKQAQLQEIEEQLAKKLEKKNEKPKQDGFVEKLATQVIKNIQVHVKNIHIRFEDEVTIPNQPFVLGVTLSSLDLQTTNENWIPTLLDESVKVIYKMVSLNSLAVYWNCKPNMLFSKASREDQLKEFQRTIAYGGYLPDSYTYIIKPMCMNTKLRLNPHPENDLSKPKIMLQVVLDELGLNLSCLQFHGLMELVESLDRMSVNAPFRKYRPDVPLKSNAKLWWKYAYNCVLEAGVRRKMQMFSWEHIKEHKRKVREYRELYKEKLKQKKPSQNLIDKLIKMENDLDIFNITLTRQAAEAELARSGISIRSKKSAHQIEESSSSWFGGWFGGKKKKEEPEESGEKKDTIDTLMDEKEKALLYEAIGYTDGETPKPTSYPKDYVEISADVALNLISVRLKDDKNLGNVSVLSVSLQQITTGFKMLPTIDGIQLTTQMKDFQVDGLEQDGLLPHMIMSDFAAIDNLPGDTAGQNLLSVQFEKNPLDETCDQRVVVNARPLQIIYDAATINNLITFFKPPDDIQLQQIRAVAASTYEDIKVQTATGLKYAMATRKMTSISINIMSSYVVVPENGHYVEGCSALVLDLGQIILKSMNEGQTPTSRKAFFTDESTGLEEMRQQAYDKFLIEVNKIQLLLAGEGDDWILSRTLDASPLHILEPLSVRLNLQKCVIENDSALPKLKVDGCLPLVSLKISDAKLQNALKLATSIPLPPSDPEPKAPLIKYEAWNMDENRIKSTDMKTMDTVFNKKEPSGANTSSDEFYTAESDMSDFDEETAAKMHRKVTEKESTQEMKQLTDVQASFEIAKISIGIAQHTSNGDQDMLDLTIEQFGASSKVRTWETSVDAHLGSITVEYKMGKMPDGKPLYLLNTPTYRGSRKLLTVKILIAKQTAPDFLSTYKNTEQNLDIRFSVFEINANSKAILEIKEFAQKLIPPSAEPTETSELPPSPAKSSVTLVTHTDTTMTSGSAQSSASREGTGGSSDETIRGKKKKHKTKKRKKRKRTSIANVEITKMKLNAVLETFSINIADDDKPVANIAIKGVEASVALKPSCTTVTAKLHDLMIIDPTDGTLYPKILCAEGEDVLMAHVIQYNNATVGEGYNNMENVDTSVKLHLGSLRFVFVNRFVTSLVKLGEKFQDAKEVAKEAGAAAQKAATQSVMRLVEKNPRIKLDVYVGVPKILIPRDTKSRDVIIANLGNVKVMNFFSIIGSHSSGTPAVCENMKATIKEIKVSLCQLDENSTVLSEYQLLEPVSLEVDIKRNLALAWFHEVPDIAISGSMNDINVKASGADLSAAMKILDGNLSEGALPPQPEQNVIKQATVSSPEKKEYAAEGVIAERSDTTITPSRDALKLNFRIPKVRVNLFSDKQRENPLAEFIIANLVLSLRRGSNDSMDLDVSLEDITLEDKRLSHQSGITMYVSKNKKNADAPDSFDRVIKAKLIQNSDGSKDINAAVGSLQIILCLEFILKISDLFMNALPKSPEEAVLRSIDSMEDDVMKIDSAESLVSEAATVVPRPHEPELMTQIKSKAIKIDFKLYQPDIILVTDITSNDSQALVLSMELGSKVSIGSTGDDINVTASLSNLQLVNCPFAAVQHITSEHKKILAPCTVNVKAAISPTSQEFNIDMTKIQITATPTVINTVAKTMEVLTAQTKPEGGSESAEKRVEADIWDSKNVADMQFWFIDRPEEELKPKASNIMLNKISGKKKNMSEIMKLSVPNIMILLECGQGNHTVPLLITEMKVHGEVMDWSSGSMEGNFKLALGVVYFNESLSVWEPLVEPVETDPGMLDSKYELWMVEAVIQQSPPEESGKRTVSASSEDDLPPLMSVSVKSSKVLHTTITNDAIKVLQSLGRAFADAAMSKPAKKTKRADETDGAIEFASAEAKIANMLDTPINITLGKGLIVVAKNGPETDADGAYTLGYKDYLALDFAATEDLGIWDLLQNQAKVQDNDTSKFTVSLPGGKNSATCDISKTGMSMHTLEQNGVQINLVCVIESDGGVRNITLRSPLMLKNHLTTPLQVLDKDDVLVGNVAPNSRFPLPSRFSCGENLFVKPKMDVYKAEVFWSEICSGTDFHHEKVVDCPSNAGSNHDVSLSVEIISEQIISADKDDTCYEIHIRPVAIFRNFLPYDVEFSVANGGKESEITKLISGTGSQVLSAAMKKSKIKVKLHYLEKNWAGELLLEPGVSELSVWTFKSDADDVMVLGKQITYNEGSMKITLYSPYWMVNETGFPLDYKAGDDNVSQHPAEKQDFILFSFTSKSFLSKNKLQLRVCNSSYSDGFSIDTVGSSGTITCKTKEFQYMVGTRIDLTSFGLTKIVTFSSYYTIANHSFEDLEILECGENPNPIQVVAKSKAKFWPESKLDQLKLRIKGTDNVSVNIRYSKLDSGILVKVGDIPLFVDISVTESSITVTIKNYYVGSSAVMLVNHTSDMDITFGQTKSSADKELLKAGKVKYYLWPEPTLKREISWKIGNEGKETSHDVLHDINRVLKLKMNGKERSLHYAVFVDGLQRVLLFTENKECADAVEQGLGMERANIDIDIELQGLSCSITDTKAKREVMYMAITSSGLVWEQKPKKRWTPLALKYGAPLEECYQKSSKSTLTVENYEFDLTNMKVLKPHKADLRRSFSPGISLQYTMSDHQQMMHAKINRIQVDNQLPAAVFPVVLHPMPMPKTVAIDSSPKSFVELSLLQHTSKHQTFPHIKYFKVLVQEFSVKLDMGFIAALLPVFGADAIQSTPERDLKHFNYDVANAKKMNQSEEVTSDDIGITFYDLLHLSPIKVHVSFSMQNTSTGENGQTAKVVQLPFNALAVVLKSIGVTVSDIDDVVFKLGYFEREYQFFNSKQFQNAITVHYAGQAIKQLYVLVFGLDVIGNPYGLVMGIAEGVTDLFYEPYQGMIQGPGEFAEGLALGAKSLLGHTVGGAAGAVSRVTGALGKGVAALTMDDEFKKKRQMQKNKPTDLKEGLARGGKGLVMGIVGGVTGVVTKPMEGAKKEGAAGFFKGVGKGIIGIVARPASGVIDLASNTFEGIQKLADMSEDVKRMRPARWINEETGILQPYKLKKAQGKAILLEVEKGKFAEGARYIEHVPIDKDKKSFLMLTDRTILEAHTGEIFGQWNSSWSFAYEEIVEEPHLTKDGIKLVGAKTKKLFGMKSHQRTVSFYQEENGTHVLQFMKKTWADYQQGRKAGSFKESKSHHRTFHKSKKHKH